MRPRRLAALIFLEASAASACAGDDDGGCGDGVTCPFAEVGYARVQGTVTRADGSPYAGGPTNAVGLRCGPTLTQLTAAAPTDAAGGYRFDLGPLYAVPPEPVRCEVRVGLTGFRPETVAVRFAAALADRPTTVVDLREGARVAAAGVPR